jgi:hypothetical protein
MDMVFLLTIGIILWGITFVIDKKAENNIEVELTTV